MAAPHVARGRPGLLRGIWCVPVGIGYVAKTPAAWPSALVPSALAIAIAGVLSALSIWKVPAWMAELLGPPSSQWGVVGSVVAQVLATGAAIVLSALLGFALAQPLSGPALERIVKLHDAELGLAAPPPSTLGQEILRSTGSMLVSYAFGIPVIVLLFVLGIALPFAMVITKPLELVVAALTLAWDLLDYPMSVRGMPVRDRIAFVWRNPGAVFGFGLGLALCGLVPCLLFLLLPAGAAGAARLTSEIARWESRPS